jgi:twitching motility protein PilT
MLAGSLQGIVAQVLLPRADRPGRVAAHEVCIATHAVKALIREDKVHQIPTAIQTGARLGMQSLAGSIQRLAAENRISRATAESALLEYCGTADVSVTPAPTVAPAPVYRAPTTSAAAPGPAGVPARKFTHGTR